MGCFPVEVMTGELVESEIGEVIAAVAAFRTNVVKRSLLFGCILHLSFLQTKIEARQCLIHCSYPLFPSEKRNAANPHVSTS